MEGREGAVPRATFAPPLIRLQRGGGEHAPTPLKFKQGLFSCTHTMEMDCMGDGCQGWRTLGHMDEDREEDDICYLSVGGISLICFLSLVLHYYCEPVLQYCEPELECKPIHDLSLLGNNFCTVQLAPLR